MTTQGVDENSAVPSAPVIKPVTKRDTARYVLILGSLMAFGPPLSIDMYLPALPAMRDDLHSTDTSLQLTLTAFIIGLILGQLVIGPLSDAIGRRKPLLMGLAFYVAASVVCALSPSLEILISARVVQALGAAACLVTVRAIVRDLYSGKEMTKFISLLVMVTLLAPILAPLLGGQILRFTSWRGIFLALAIFGVLLLIAVVARIPESLPTTRRQPARIGAALRNYSLLLRERVFLGYALAAGFLAAGVFAYLSASSFALQGVYHLTPQAYSLVFGANALGMLLGGQFNRILVDRFSERKLLTAGLLASVAGGLGTLLAATLHLDLVWLLIPLWVLIASTRITVPNLMSLALADQSANAGTASALLGVLQYAVGAIAAPLVGLGPDNTAVPMTLALAGTSIAALLIVVTLARSGHLQPTKATA